MWISNSPMLISIKYIPWARHCSKYFAYLISFYPHKDFIRQVLIYLHFTANKTKAQRLRNMLKVSHLEMAKLGFLSGSFQLQSRGF